MTSIILFITESIAHLAALYMGYIAFLAMKVSDERSAKEYAKRGGAFFGLVCGAVFYYVVNYNYNSSGQVQLPADVEILWRLYHTVMMMSASLICQSQTLNQKKEEKKMAS